MQPQNEQPRILVLTAPGSEDIETVVPVNIWRRAGLTVDVCAINDQSPVVMSRGVKIVADKTIETIDPSNYSLLFLPGGPGHSHFLNSEKTKALIKVFYESGQKIAAICAAPSVLGKLGYLKNKQYTGYPGTETDWQGKYQTDTVVVDLPFITAQGPSSAIEFALVVLSQLTNKNTAQRIAKDILLNNW